MSEFYHADDTPPQAVAKTPSGAIPGLSKRPLTDAQYRERHEAKWKPVIQRKVEWHFANPPRDEWATQKRERTFRWALFSFLVNLQGDCLVGIFERTARGLSRATYPQEAKTFVEEFLERVHMGTLNGGVVSRHDLIERAKHLEMYGHLQMWHPLFGRTPEWEAANLDPKRDYAPRWKQK